jgi:hypothetical protein
MLLNDWAVGSILRASGTRALAAAMAASGHDLAGLGENEVAEGIVRLAASEALSERSDELAVEGFETMVAGAEEVETAAGLGDRSRAAEATGIAEATEGAAALGAAAEVTAQRGRG